MTMFAGQTSKRYQEEKKDVFAPVADLMVGVVFVFIILVLALSLHIVDDFENGVSRSVYDELKRDRDEKVSLLVEASASKKRLAEFVRYIQDTGVMPMLSRLAESNERRTKILNSLSERLEKEKIHVEIDRDNGTLRLDSARLFESSRADPTPEGASVIRLLGMALAEVTPCYLSGIQRPATCPEDRTSGILSAVYIEGHTDAAVIRRRIDRFRDNWDLSAARAIEAYKIVRESDPRISTLRNGEGKALIGVSGYAATRPVNSKNFKIDSGSEIVDEADRRIEVRLIMAIDREEVLATLGELNSRLEVLNADLK